MTNGYYDLKQCHSCGNSLEGCVCAKVCAYCGAVDYKWIEVENELPETGRMVLVYYKNSYDKIRRVTAFYARRFCFEATLEDECEIEYNEDDDNFYLMPGWYERIDNWAEYSSVFIHEGRVTHWMPLPEPPKKA